MKYTVRVKPNNGFEPGAVYEDCTKEHAERLVAINKRVWAHEPFTATFTMEEQKETENENSNS
jgi:hypothetical protein